MNLRVTGTALTVALGILLSGCGGSDPHKGDDVASVAGAATSRPSASATPEERPLIRTDTSPEEEQRLYDVWEDCLAKHGAGTEEERKLASDAAQGGPLSKADPAGMAKYKKAAAACASKEPEEVWERAKRLDPAYADKLRDWVTCIRAHGIDAWESDGFLTFESLPPDNQMKEVDACQDKAFGKG